MVLLFEEFGNRVMRSLLREGREAQCHRTDKRDLPVIMHNRKKGHRYTHAQRFDISKKKLLKTLITMFPW